MRQIAESDSEKSSGVGDEDFSQDSRA